MAKDFSLASAKLCSHLDCTFKKYSAQNSRAWRTVNASASSSQLHLCFNNSRSRSGGEMVGALIPGHFNLIPDFNKIQKTQTRPLLVNFDLIQPASLLVFLKRDTVQLGRLAIRRPDVGKV